MNLIIHIDMDAFFASCHEAQNPNLKKLPIVVSRNNSRSVVSTANYVARKYNINSGMPLYKAKEACKNLVVVYPDHKMYELYSAQIRNLLKVNFSKEITTGSIDEWFLDCTSILKKYKTVKNLVTVIQKMIWNNFKLTCSVGASFNMLFAKMASEYRKPNGITIISPNNFKEIIYPLKINKVPGIGPKSSKLLSEIGIWNIKDLVIASENRLLKIKLKAIFNDRLDGYIALFKTVHTTIKINEFRKQLQISHGETFLSNIVLWKDLKPVIEKMCRIVILKSQKEKKAGNVILCKIKFNTFITISKSLSIGYYTNDYELFAEKCKKMIYEMWDKITPIRFITVSLNNLLPTKDLYEQRNIFENGDLCDNNSKSKIKKLTTTEEWIEKINKKHNKKILSLADDIVSLKVDKKVNNNDSII